MKLLQKINYYIKYMHYLGQLVKWKVKRRNKSKALNSSNTIVWTDVTGDQDNYEVERSVNGGGWADIATGLAANTTSYQNSTITTGNIYRYRVAPYFTGSVYSTWCYADTLTQNLGTFPN